MAEVFDPFDRASRYLLRKNDRVLLPWLLGLAPAEMDLVQWLDTRRIPWPGQPERTCDTVAHVLDLEQSGPPWAVIVEFQLKPDPDMFGRALIYLGQLYLDLRPTPHAGDRFCVAAVVVNLTGDGKSSREFHWPKAGLRTALLIGERNLAQFNAADVLDGVETGTVPRPVLAWTPLMRGGDDGAIVERWLTLAGQEPDARRRADLGVVLVFAEAAGCKALWEEALKGWNMVESQVVKEWQRQARESGELRGIVVTLVEVLKARVGVLPPDLADAILATTDLARLKQWTTLAARADSLDQFRHDAGL